MGAESTTKPYHSYIQECAQDFPKGGGTRMTLAPPHHAQGGAKLHLPLPHMCTPMLEMQQYKNFEGGGEGGERGGGGEGPPPQPL